MEYFEVDYTDFKYLQEEKQNIRIAIAAEVNRTVERVSEELSSIVDSLLAEEISSEEDEFVKEKPKSYKSATENQDFCGQNSRSALKKTCRQETIVQNEDPFGDVGIVEIEIEPISEMEVNKLSKKKSRNESNWKINKRKTLREAGKSYISVFNKKIPARSVKTRKDCLSKCAFKCHKCIDDNERKNIFESFYSMDRVEKARFILKCTEKLINENRKVKGGDISRKNYIFKYYFFLFKNRIRVCKTFFLSTLDISQNQVYTSHMRRERFGNKLLFSQGKHTKKVTPQSIQNDIREHIKSFPIISMSADDSEQYLDRVWSIAGMYRLYKEEMQRQGRDFAKQPIYRKIFKTEFNFGFLKQKKRDKYQNFEKP